MEIKKIWLEKMLRCPYSADFYRDPRVDSDQSHLLADIFYSATYNQSVKEFLVV